MRGSWIFCCLPLLACAAPALARTALFVQGVAAGEGLDPAFQHDLTQLRGYADATAPPAGLDNLNYGAAGLVSVGREKTKLSRALIRFPIAGLAGQYTHITGARLILSLSYRTQLDITHPHLPLPIAFQLHRVLAANADWVEGSAAQAAEIPGAVCWAWRKSPATAWQGARGCGKPGVDYQSAPLASASITTAGWSDGTRLVFTIPAPAFLDDWIRHPQNNAGFLLRSAALENLPTTDTVLIKFFTDDETSLIWRPRLEIEYDALPDEPLATAPFQAGVAAGAPDPAYDTMGSSLCGAGGLTYGAAPDLRVGIAPVTQLWRSPLRFDLARLHDRADAVRALRLTLTVGAVQSGPQTLAAFHLLQLDRIAAANAVWREGTAAAAAEPGAAAWDWLAQGARRWAGGALAGAGLQAAGVDYATPPLATRVLVPAELRPGDTLVFDIAYTLALRDWLLDPATNAGFRLSSPTLEGAGPAALGLILFDSDDAATAARRPRLELIYSAAAPPSAADPAWTALLR